MARRRKAAANESTPQPTGSRHGAKRVYNPPAGIAAQARVRETPKAHYSYDPHLAPKLHFNATGPADVLPEIVDKATREPLTEPEARAVLIGLGQHQPWLEWTSKRETQELVVDPVPLHIHERVSTQAILKMARRESIQRNLFADPEHEYGEALQFYKRDVAWANRLILGDSLQVMSSLVEREHLAGKVQMIYLDPPYGIRFASNFQSEIGKRDVREKEADLTREPEMIKAYRDTWTLGVHSYLAYLRDRLMLCRRLLTDTGSIFLQISDENMHRVRLVMDEVFGGQNFCGHIVFRKTTGKGSAGLDSTFDSLLWYACDVSRVAYHTMYFPRHVDQDDNYRFVLTSSGEITSFSSARAANAFAKERSGRVFSPNPLTSQSASATTLFEFQLDGERFSPGKGGWKTNVVGMQRLAHAGRLLGIGKTLRFARHFDDLSYQEQNNIWDDTRQSGFGDAKVYVVQTSRRVIERCLLMTTAPGDLVLDPTCGSGTTAYVAERWGRRWITIDSSRVALAIARQRLLTSKFDQYETKPPKVENGRAHAVGDPANGFVYKTVPHITLKSIAQNTGLDPIFARHAPILNTKLAKLNAALKKVSPELQRRLATKLAEKEKREGRRSITDADRRRWLLPASEWKDWEIPFDADDEWPAALVTALGDYRAAWRSKMDEVDAAIAANAEPEELVDQPEVVPGVVRVSGPFTVEAIMPAEESLEDSPIEQADGDLETFGASSPAADAFNGEAYLDRMRRLLLADGVRFPDNKVAKISRLDPLDEPYLHAEGEWNVGGGKLRRVVVSFGPQHGPVTAVQVEEALHAASRRGCDDVVFAGFNFDGAAQAVIQDDPNPRVRAHLAHIRPDIEMGGLLKNTPSSQLFTVFGTPRTRLDRDRDGTFRVTMEGVDIYDPVENAIVPTRADKVAAWFLDTDYDGRTFCITQAFFPDKTAWEKLARALKGYLDEERFAELSGTISLPFEAGSHARCAVKVIDPRGNEVMRIHRLEAAGRPHAGAR